MSTPAPTKCGVCGAPPLPKYDPEEIIKEGTNARSLQPIELLAAGNIYRTPNALSVVWPEVLGVFFGLCIPAGLNFATRRPIFSGIHKYVISLVLWTGALKGLWHVRNNYLIEKDAVLRHYVELHPKVWPPVNAKTLKLLPKRKKFGDPEVLQNWYPIR